MREHTRKCAALQCAYAHRDHHPRCGPPPKGRRVSANVCYGIHGFECISVPGAGQPQTVASRYPFALTDRSASSSPGNPRVVQVRMIRVELVHCHRPSRASHICAYRPTVPLNHKSLPHAPLCASLAACACVGACVHAAATAPSARIRFSEGRPASLHCRSVPTRPHRPRCRARSQCQACVLSTTSDPRTYCGGCRSWEASSRCPRSPLPDGTHLWRLDYALRIMVKGPLSSRELLPDWMSFIHAEIDLSRSRERIDGRKLRNEVSRTFVAALKAQKDTAPATYAEFWELHGDHLASGACPAGTPTRTRTTQHTAHNTQLTTHNSQHNNTQHNTHSHSHKSTRTTP